METSQTVAFNTAEDALRRPGQEAIQSVMINATVNIQSTLGDGNYCIIFWVSPLSNAQPSQSNKFKYLTSPLHRSEWLFTTLRANNGRI